MKTNTEQCGPAAPRRNDCGRLNVVGLLLAYAALVARTGPVVERPARRLALIAIGFYRAALTRLTSPCPQEISCSAFAVQAVRECGPVVGLRLAAYRIGACAAPSHTPRAEGFPKEAPGCNS